LVASAWLCKGVHVIGVHPSGLFTRTVEDGLFISLPAGRRGRASSSPPQFGQRAANTSEHEAQKVHSNEQIRASVVDGGKSLLQHSQFGLSSSMVSFLVDMP
jgi:hypothetical protein